MSPEPSRATALMDTAALLVADGKGLLAADESTATCNRRFAAAGIPQTGQARQAYRNLIVGTAGLGESISGVICYDETLRQTTGDGTPFVTALTDAGITAGIKVDTGTTPLAGAPGERVTEGLDGLRERLEEYARLGARFAKWRAVFTITDTTPSPGAVAANTHALARYAALCQEAGLVPVVEPEVLMTGAHPLARSAEVTETVLRAVFAQLADQHVQLEGMLLKPNMALPGSGCPDDVTIAEVADATVRVLRRTVPAAVPGVLFLSGGQSPELASARLNAMNSPPAAGLPWALGFSYGRAIQQPALDLWRGRPDRVAAAQHALAHRARCNRAARRGRYTPLLDHPDGDPEATPDRADLTVPDAHAAALTGSVPR